MTTKKQGNLKLILTFLLLSIIEPVAWGQNYPPVPLPDTTGHGHYISRSLALMANSTAEKPGSLRVLFYGQSLTRQAWHDSIEQYLKTRYPHTRFVFENMAVNSFYSYLLLQIAARDVALFLPDLIIFHDYGDMENFEQILFRIRSQTSAEMLVWNDHYLGPDDGYQERSMEAIPALCEKYALEFVDIRTPWKKYITQNNYQPSQLLKDEIHFNEHGNYVLSQCLMPFFEPISSHNSDPLELVKTYTIGRDVNWLNDQLVLQFSGNRVELLLDEVNKESGDVHVLIDDKPPSDFAGCYIATRPYKQTSKEQWPWQYATILCAGWHAPLIAEDWTLRLTKTDRVHQHHQFDLHGSKTGYDGRTWCYETFISNSGRVVINPQWWFLNHPNSWFPVHSPEEGYEIKWSVLPRYCDTITSEIFRRQEDSILICQGLENTTHRLLLEKTSGELPPIKAIRVYQPYWRHSSAYAWHIQEEAIELNASQNFEATCVISSNAVWEAHSTKNWLQLDTDKGIGSDTLNIKLKNPEAIDKLAHIIFTINGQVVDTVSVTTSLNANTLNNAPQVNFNASYQNLYVTTRDTTASMSIKVFRLNGQCITDLPSQRQHLKIIDTSPWAEGLYIVIVQINSVPFAQKVLITKN